ncbi:hypothetical protein [Raoultella terrigena]|uniref:hypothetical protein n=1 Tax=Raoultella terrigena TaxID=577 RepID=UPI002DB7BEA5|nr:hypothetical protein [Raoultella terrigena]MEB7601419.1 glycoside hydrolase family 55 protein [Raoultella terrigena]
MNRRDLLLGVGVLGASVPLLAKAEFEKKSVGAMADISEAIVFKTPEMFGATGDGISDDTSAIQRAAEWLTSHSFYKLIFNPGKVYRVTKTITFEFGKDVFGCSVDMQGPVKPDQDTGDCMVFNRAVGAVLHLSVIGDGVDEGDEIPDYSTPDPKNGQQAFIINASRSTRITCIGFGFKGRVLRTKSTGNLKTSFLEINLWTGDKNFVFKNGRCGQAAYLEGDTDAFGLITNAYTNWDVYGSILYKLTDLTIGHWEYGAGTRNPALSIIGCQTVHAVVLSGGASSGNYSVLKIQPAKDQRCIGINIQRLFVTCGKNNLEIIGGGIDDIARKPLTINSLYSYKSSDNAVLVDGASNIEINNAYIDDTKNGIAISGICSNIQLTGYIKNPGDYGIVSFKDSEVRGLVFTGRILSSSSTRCCIDLSRSSLSRAIIRDSYIFGTHAVFDLNDNNEVSVFGGYVEGNSVFIDNRPKIIKDVGGVKTKATGNEKVNKESIVHHGLISIPNEVNVTPLGKNKGFYVSEINNKTFTITISESNDEYVEFMWSASCES